MKASIRFGAAALMAATFGLAPLEVSASPVTYNFTVTGTSGPLNGVMSTGSFTFDSSLEVPNTVDQTVGLFSALNFTWNGITYTAATANTGSLTFDSSGMLEGATFGTNCMAGGCSIQPGTNEWLTSATGFDYTVASNSDVPFSGTFSSSPAATTVPEPLTLSLFGAGLIGAASMRRRKAK